MDTSVALVQAYLHVNGYFTVAEYPVLEAYVQLGLGHWQCAQAQETNVVSTLGMASRQTGPIKWVPFGSASQPLYTRSVQWRHRIAVVLLTVLAGLPVSGIVCAMVCESASSAAATHHGSGQKCEDPAPPPRGPQISGYPEHDCNTHDGAIRQASTTAAERADVTTKSSPIIIGAVAIESVALRNPQTFFDYSSPPGTAPPTTTPLVLRV
jgi:hypothetical protein